MNILKCDKSVKDVIDLKGVKCNKIETGESNVIKNVKDVINV